MATVTDTAPPALPVVPAQRRPPAAAPTAAATHTVVIGPARRGEALITCSCGSLRTVVDVDDPDAAAFVLGEHRRRHPGEDQLLVQDVRPDQPSVRAAAAVPEARADARFGR